MAASKGVDVAQVIALYRDGQPHATLADEISSDDVKTAFAKMGILTDTASLRRYPKAACGSGGNQLPA